MLGGAEDGTTVNLAGVAGVPTRRVLQLALGFRTGGQLDEAWRMGLRAGCDTRCVLRTFFVDDEAGLRLAVVTSRRVHSNAGRCIHYSVDAPTWTLRYELRSCVAMFLGIGRLPSSH